MEQGVLSVSTLNNTVKMLLEEAQFLRDIEVKGEISNIRFQRSGHIYFSLKDESSQISCVLFKWQAQYLKVKPEEGMEIIAKGSINVYHPRGTYQLVVKSLKKEGKGELFQQFLELKEKLKKEGLFDQKKQLPAMPEVVGIVTSPSGAAIQDMISTISRRFPLGKIILSPATVQGPTAAQTIISALLKLEKRKEVELIIVGRGGGSIEDLWCFNDEAVARTIAKMKTPVISAVGHETDFTIADFVADARAETPTAAAEMAYPNIEDWVANLDYMLEDLGHNLLSQVSRDAQKLDDIENHLDDLILRRIEDQIKILDLMDAKLEATDLSTLLEQGFSLTFHKGKRLNDISKIKVGDELDTVLSNGRLKSEVIKKEK